MSGDVQRRQSLDLKKENGFEHRVRISNFGEDETVFISSKQNSHFLYPLHIQIPRQSLQFQRPSFLQQHEEQFLSCPVDTK